MGKVTFDLPAEVEQAFERIAQRSGRSQDAVVQEAIQALVEEQGQPLSLTQSGRDEQRRDHAVDREQAKAVLR